MYACNSSNNCYSSFGSGTSWACPLAAGAAALLLQVAPNLTPMQLASLLKNTASQSNNPDNLYGWGIINTYAAAQSLLTDTNTWFNFLRIFIFFRITQIHLILQQKFVLLFQKNQT